MHHTTDLFYLPPKYYYTQMGSRLSKAVEELVKKKIAKRKRRGEVIHTLGGFSTSHQASWCLKNFLPFDAEKRKGGNLFNKFTSQSCGFVEIISSGLMGTLIRGFM